MKIFKPLIFWQTGDANDNSSLHGYSWWYFDGLFTTNNYTLAISFHISNKSMMSWSTNTNPAYKLTIAKILSSDLSSNARSLSKRIYETNIPNESDVGVAEESVKILIHDKVLLGNEYIVSDNGIAFKNGFLKKDGDQFRLFLKQPELELVVSPLHSCHISPRIGFPFKIFMQQIQYATGDIAQLKFSDYKKFQIPGVLNGSSYIENVFGNKPCFFALKEWFWMRINCESANIVIAYAKTNIIGFFKPISMIHIEFKSGQSFSAENIVNTSDFKKFFINHPDLKLILSITKFSHFQDYSPFKRIKGIVGNIADKLLDGKCIRSVIKVNILMESHQLDFKHNDCIGICEIRSFYGYNEKLKL